MSTPLTEEAEYRIAAFAQVPVPNAFLTEEGRHVADAEALVAHIGMERQFRDVQLLTQELFPGDVRVGADFDPECPQVRFVVFQVTSPEAIERILLRQREWNRGLLRLAPDALNFFRLSVSPP